MKAYKGFNKDMTCRGFQYNEGGEYETVADVVDEMRRFADRHWMHDEGQNVRLFADRIEKAVSSETPAARHNSGCVSSATHNAATGKLVRRRCDSTPSIDELRRRVCK